MLCTPFLAFALLVCFCLTPRRGLGWGAGRGRHRNAKDDPALEHGTWIPISGASLLALAAVASLIALDIMPLLDDLVQRRLERKLWTSVQLVCQGEMSSTCAAHFIILVLLTLVWLLIVLAAVVCKSPPRHEVEYAGETVGAYKPLEDTTHTDQPPIEMQARQELPSSSLLASRLLLNNYPSTCSSDALL